MASTAAQKFEPTEQIKETEPKIAELEGAEQQRTEQRGPAQSPNARRPWATYAVCAMVFVAVLLIIGLLIIGLWNGPLPDNSGPARPLPDGYTTDFPKIEDFGLHPLTKSERETPDGKLRDEYRYTTIAIHNATTQNIRLAFHYLPASWDPDKPQAQQYAYRVTETISPGETFDDKPPTGFGGPVYISVFARNKWTPIREWKDLRIVSRRTIKVEEVEGAFQCTLEF